MSAASIAERTLIVGLDVTTKARTNSPLEFGPSVKESLAELATLAEGAGALVVDRLAQTRPTIDAATLLGSGKVAEIAQRVTADRIDLVIFDHELTPTQLRNLEKRLQTKILDRNQLILDIFASRARTSEGQLQVELAQLTYLLPRLAGRGTLMSRLGGGIGTRGPGETQLETDRRRIGQRIAKLKADIERVRATRGVQRSQRQAVPLSTISLVGYTNAGKSTLFNRLTGADVLADARIFATLDPTVRQVKLPSQRRVLLSDTVGFIRNLPTTLVDAFRATLEEVTAAALLLHVVDISTASVVETISARNEVLAEIDAEATPQILVLNKADQLPDFGRGQEVSTVTHRLLGETARQSNTGAAFISARSGQGIEALRTLIDQHLMQDPVSRQRFRLPLGEGRALHLLHERAAVVSKHYAETFCEVVADVPLSLKNRLAEFTVGDTSD